METSKVLLKNLDCCLKKLFLLVFIVPLSSYQTKKLITPDKNITKYQTFTLLNKSWTSTEYLKELLKNSWRKKLKMVMLHIFQTQRVGKSRKRTLVLHIYYKQYITMFCYRMHLPLT